MKDWSPCHCKHMNSVIQKTSLTAWQTKMSPHTAKAEILWFLHLYYQKPLDFTEAKILWFKHKVTRVPWFYFHFLYFNRSTIEVSSYNSNPPICQSTTRVKVCLSLVQMSASQAARMAPAEMLMVSPGAACLYTDATWCPKLRCPSTVLWGVLACLSSPHCSTWLDIAQLGLGLTGCIYSKGRVRRIPQKGSWDRPTQTKYETRITHILLCCINVSSVSSSASQEKKNLGEILCSLPKLFFC